MEFTTLGRTGLHVSRMGLGCGGHSRLGKSNGLTEDESIRVVQAGLDLGINFIDTAEAYGTEEIVGKALASTPRDHVVISTKVGFTDSADEFRSRVLGCLERLRTDYVDILHIHGLKAEEHSRAHEILVPVLKDLQAEGKVRFIGVTEAFAPDPTHQMLRLAKEDELWDVVMVGFNVLNQSARHLVLNWTQARNVGVLGMFAVRKALSRPERLRELIGEMVASGEIDAADFDLNDPLGFLVSDGVASSVTEASYRFCRWEPGIDLVLSGTGNVEHLRQNAHSLSLPPLPEQVNEKLRRLFARVEQVSGN